MIAPLAVGDSIPLCMQLFNYNEAKYVQVKLYDDSLDLIDTVQLSPVGDTGFYQNNEVEMPNVPFVIAQYVVYDDAGYTTVSSYEGGTADTFIRNELDEGDVLPLVVQLYNYDAAKYPQAKVTDPNGEVIDGSPFTLNAVGSLGLYVGLTAEVPSEMAYAVAQYLIYDDVGHTTLSSSQGAANDTFFFTIASLDFGNLPNVSDAMLDWFQPMTFVRIAKSIEDFGVSESREAIKFMGVWQPMGAQSLNMKPQGQRDWKWFQCHADVSLELKPDDMIKYLGVKYRVSAKLDYKRYGYMEYHLVEDYK